MTNIVKIREKIGKGQQKQREIGQKIVRYKRLIKKRKLEEVDN